MMNKCIRTVSHSLYAIISQAKKLHPNIANTFQILFFRCLSLNTYWCIAVYEVKAKTIIVMPQSVR